MYALGEGGVVDPVEAQKWLVIAANAGDAAAISNLKKHEARIEVSLKREGDRRAKSWTKKSKALLPDIKDL